MNANGSPPESTSRVVVLNQGTAAKVRQRLSPFIRNNGDLIIREWQDFARTLTTTSAGMTPLALRDHIHQILAFLVSDMDTSQTPSEQSEKSHGDKRQVHPVTAAQTHAALRLAGGFDIGQMVSEYRALRASILRLWQTTGPVFDAVDIGDMTRFNEAIDQELAESVAFYTLKVAESKELITSMLSHDLRGPLQAITLSAELTLHMGRSDARQTMLTNKILESADRMSGLIANLLDVTRARFGARLPIVSAVMNMGFVARQIVDEVRIVNPSRPIELTMSGILTGEWDKARIGQVFSNLLNNAVQYGFQGSPVCVDIKGDATAVTLSVSNDGLPIPAAKIGLIFDPLTRVLQNEEGALPSANLGLGLYITREIVVAHGGTIDVASSDTEGTTFTARFPKAAPPSVSRPAQRQTSP